MHLMSGKYLTLAKQPRFRDETSALETFIMLQATHLRNHSVILDNIKDLYI
jgi:hypothetical protein